MDDKVFNLQREPWIRVMAAQGRIETVSLLELFEGAPTFRGLAGELPTQDVAVLRLLLAILHVVFTRWDTQGQEAPILEPAAALERWKALWDKGAFPMEVIERYLMQYEDHFYLFHPQRPFYQVAGLDKSTEYTAAKLNGELSESGNKIRLFPQRTGDAKRRLRFSEAARWLLYVHAFDDTSAKPKQKGLPSPGAGWLGKLGLVMAVGENLFETLLLNLVLLRDGGNELWGEESPIWEAEEVKAGERTQIPMPQNPSELLTLQSRRLLLQRDGDEVVGYALLGGDFFSRENAFAEQMTVWRNAAKKEGDPPLYLPRRHDPARQLWRDFSALIVQAEGQRRPGIVAWLARLKAYNFMPRSHFCFQTAGVKYGDKDFFVDDVFSDALSLNADLLTDMGEDWVGRILGEIEATERLVSQVGYLAQNLAKASGNREGIHDRDAAQEQAYFRLDASFRLWLEGIDPREDENDMEAHCDLWWNQAKQIVQALGSELVRQSGPQAFIGRRLKEKIKGKEEERRYTAPEAYNQFLYRIGIRNAI